MFRIINNCTMNNSRILWKHYKHVRTYMNVKSAIMLKLMRSYSPTHSSTPQAVSSFVFACSFRFVPFDICIRITLMIDRPLSQFIAILMILHFEMPLPKCHGNTYKIIVLTWTFPFCFSHFFRSASSFGVKSKWFT